MELLDHADEPALVRRQLGRHLRRLRLAAGKTHGDAETAGMPRRRGCFTPSELAAWLDGARNAEFDHLAFDHLARP